MGSKFKRKAIQTSVFLASFLGGMYLFNNNSRYDCQSNLGFENVFYETKSPFLFKGEKYDIVENISGGKILYDVKSQIDYSHLVNGSDKNYKINEMVFFGDTINFDSSLPKKSLRKSAESRANYLINAKSESEKFQSVDSFMRENLESLLDLSKEVKSFRESSFI